MASLALALMVGAGSPAIVHASAAPVITSDHAFAVSEGTTGVTTLTATDTDTATADLTWSKTGGADADKFNLSSAGLLAFASAKDFENPDDDDTDGSYQVTVEVSDGANTDSADLVITLENVIEMTSLTGPSAVNYEENKAVRVATYSASSEQDAHALRWSLSGDDADNFRIDEPAGALRFDIDTVSPNLFAQQPDYEDPEDDDEDGIYKVTVQVRRGNESHTLDVEVSITDQNEAGDLTLSTTRPQEGEAVTANLTDEDGVVGTPTYTWERSDGRSDWVTISGATGANYTPTAGETGHFLRVTVSYEDGHGTGQSATASSKEEVVGNLLHSLTVTTDDSTGGATWRQFRPTFDSGTLHYSVGCNNSDTMSLTLAAADADARIAVNGVQVENPGAETATTVSQSVEGDSKVRITLTGSDGSLTTYVVHCAPDHMLEVTTVKRVDAGYIEDLIMFPQYLSGDSNLLIIDNNGVPRFIRDPDFGYKDGLYFRWFRLDEGDEWRYGYGTRVVPTWGMVVLDQNFEVLETVQTVSPLRETDYHDYLVLPNGDYLLMSYEPATRDFSFLPFGDYGTDEDVRDSVIQHRTAEGEEVYRWNSYDHMGFEDCNVAGSVIHDYAHVNSLQMLDDGDIVASFRRCHKILRIDPDEDEVVWRVGPTAMTDEQWEEKDRGPAPFTFIDDPAGEFGGQHAAQVLPGNRLILFDNGTPILVNPWTGELNREKDIYGRGVEYAIDPEHGEAVFVRDHSLHGTRSIPAGPGGHIDLLSNGDWLVSWGDGSLIPSRDTRDEVATQVDPDTGVEKWSLKALRIRSCCRQAHKVRAISLDPVALTDVPQPLAAEFVAEQSAFSYADAADRPEVVIAFNRPVVDFTKDTPSVSVTGATIDSVDYHGEAGVAAHAYKFKLVPDGSGDITFTVLTDKACDSATGGICTADGATLATTPTAGYRITEQISVNFAQGAYTVAEGATVEVGVTLTADPGETVSIPLTTTAQGNTSADDYSGVPSSLTFDSGETSKTFTFSATPDTIDDDNDSVAIGFGAMPSGFGAGATSATAISITDDDAGLAKVGFGAKSYAVSEGSSVVVTVSLDNALTEAVTVPITTVDQDGATGDDYSGIPASVTFAAGDTSATFTVDATADSTYDDNESVLIGFGTLPDGVDLDATAETTVTITDPNPPQVKVSFGSATYDVSEDGGLWVPITLDADPQREVVIPFTRTGQNGFTDADIARIWESVTFQSGETSVNWGFRPMDDAIDDEGESVVIGLGTLPNGVTAGDIPATTVSVIDNDPSSDATLSALTLVDDDARAVTLTPAFAAATAEYSASVSYDVGSVTLTATTNHSSASVSVIQSDGTTTADVATVDLDVGENLIQATVTAEDEVTTLTYTVTVTRAPAWSATLTVGVQDDTNAPPASGYSRWTRMGAVSSSDFTADGARYRVMTVLQLANSLFLNMMRSEMPSDFTLTLGDQQFLASESSKPSAGAEGRYRWALDEEFDWDAGETVEVSIIPDEDSGSLSTRAAPPPAAFAHGIPESHDGENSFTFGLSFTENPNLSFRTLRDEAFDVTNGTVTRAKRTSQGSDQNWVIHVRPDSDADVTISLAPTTDCAASDAICTSDGRKHYNSVEFTVAGP